MLAYDYYLIILLFGLFLLQKKLTDLMNPQLNHPIYICIFLINKCSFLFINILHLRKLSNFIYYLIFFILIYNYF